MTTGAFILRGRFSFTARSFLSLFAPSFPSLFAPSFPSLFPPFPLSLPLCAQVEAMRAARNV